MTCAVLVDARQNPSPLLSALLACVTALCGCPGGPGGGGYPEPVCVKTVVADVEVPTQQAADVLIVVDNSASMQEEQSNLAINFLNQDPAACPLQDLTQIPAEFKNPPPPLYTGDGPLAQCGLIQLVAAFDNDFRIGVITTDVGLCDNRIPSLGPPGWGHRPQRGCLHPDSPPGGTGRKVIARADLLDDDTSNDDLAARFAATLENVGTEGSPLERGLDAVNIFLSESADKNPDCVDDLASFRRENASLVVIFLTDEDDCSHGRAADLAAFGDENAGEVCGEFPEHYITVPSARCYDNTDLLTDVSVYVDALQNKEPELKVAVIAGAVGDDDTPSGCIVGDDGTPDPTCFESHGFSNDTSSGQICAADTADQRGGLPCCVADPGTRYYQFADAMGQRATDSICNSSFRATMLRIAAFIAAVDSVLLAEKPDSPDAIYVVLKRANGEELVLPVVADDADCATDTGYRIEDDRRVVLCGDARPGPGDSLAVRARAPAAQEQCAEPRLEASGGGVNCSGGSAVPLAAVLGLLLRVRRRRPDGARR